MASAQLVIKQAARYVLDLTDDQLAALIQNGQFFARYLNVSRNLVSDWERGVKRPGGPALRLLIVIEKKGIQAIA